MYVAQVVAAVTASAAIAAPVFEQSVTPVYKFTVYADPVQSASLELAPSAVQVIGLPVHQAAGLVSAYEAV